MPNSIDQSAVGIPDEIKTETSSSPTTSTASNDKSDGLYNALINGEENLFRKILTEMEKQHGDNLKKELLNYSKSKKTQQQNKKTFLQHAIECAGERGDSWAVCSLIDKARVDPNETITEDSSSPIIEAASKGNVEILKKLVSCQNIKLDAVDFPKNKQTALHIITLKLNVANCAEEKSRYIDCLEILVSKIKELGSAKCPWIDSQDVFENTALHYAVLSGVEDAVIKLLGIGSKLGIRNFFGETAIKRIKPSTLELCLDSCIKMEFANASSNDFSITFNYSLLAPPMPPSSQLDQQTSDTGIICSNLHDEAESVNLLPTPAPPPPSPQPAQQTLNMYAEDDKIYPECEALWHLSTSPEHQYLLKHPLITSFLMLKWRLIMKFYYINLGVYIFTLLVLTAYIWLLHSGFETTVTWMKYPLGFFGIIVLVRELFQLSIAPMRYFCTLDNYIELAMIGCTIAVMVHSDDPGPYRHVSAFAVLLAWAEGFLLLGRHPKLSIYIEMFYTVSITFLKLLICYSVLLVGFGFSFFLVLCETSMSASKKTNNSTQPVGGEETPTLYPADCKNLTESKEPPFANISVSLLKVVAMMTGELDYSSLPFEAFPIASRIIFLSFLFLIAIVLFNLLNGLAVSDTQDIRNKAEILGCVSQIRLISYLESVFLGDPFHFLVDWPPCDFIRNNCRSCTILHCCFKFLHCFASNAVFFNCLPDKIIVYSSKGHKKSSLTCMKCYAKSTPISKCESCKYLADFKLKIDTLENDCKRIQEINNQRNKPTEQGSLEEILDKIEQLRTVIIGLQSERS